LSLHVLLRRGCFLFSNQAHNEERETKRQKRILKEKERHIYKMCGLVYVDRALPEENKKDSWERFNIPIICAMKKRKETGKDD